MAKKIKENNQASEVAVESIGGEKKGSVKNASTKNADYKYIISNQKVRRLAKHKKAITIMSIVLAIVITGVAIFYGAYTMVQVNSFKVFVDSSGSKVLSLSSSSTFAYGTEQLEIAGPDTMDNTTLAPLKSLTNASPIEDRLVDILESDNFVYGDGDRFIAATFFLKNVTDEQQLYNEMLNIRQVTKNIDTAMRVMLIRKRSTTDIFEVVVYAKYDIEDGVSVPEKVVPLEYDIYTPIHMQAYKDESGIERVRISHVGTEAWIAEDFYSDKHVFYNKDLALAPGESIKYGIIIWLEGWDKDCVDDKLFGTIRMDFGFEHSK